MKGFAVMMCFYIASGGINYRCDNGMEGIRLAKESLYGINGNYATK